jgi:hypothetical protein
VAGSVRELHAKILLLNQTCHSEKALLAFDPTKVNCADHERLYTGSGNRPMASA